jgi:hypothetical protein
MNGDTDNDFRSPKRLYALAERFEAEVESLKEEWEAMRDRISRQMRLASDLRREADAIEGRLFAPPTPSVATGGPTPGTQDAIVQVLEAAPTDLSANEVYAELERRGWAPLNAEKPRAAVGAALWTLANNGRIAKLGNTRGSRRWAAKASHPSQSVLDGGGT